MTKRLISQTSANIVLLALIIASSLTCFGSYRLTSQMISEDMDRALALTLREQHCNVISQDTIRTFNSHLQIAELRGKATLAVDTRGQKFKAYAHCSEATIFSLSDQRPATILCVLTGLWAIFIWYRRHWDDACRPLAITSTRRNTFGGLTYSEDGGHFFAADGKQVRLTPMQHHLMEMFFHTPSHSLTKTEICDALWPKKPDASETLYTLIKRLRPVIEQNSDLKIESDRSKAYRLKIK